MPDPEYLVPVVLSPAELQVLDVFLQDGAGNREIGQILDRSEDTVKTHMKNIMAKAGCTSRTELAVRVMRDKIRIATRQRRTGTLDLRP